LRVFLDANILFSSSDNNSATFKLLKALSDFGQAVTNPHAWEEAYRNLLHKRPENLKGLQKLHKYVTISRAFNELSCKELPPQDIPILLGAVCSECTHLWTSDKKHFGKWYGRKLFNVKIVSSILLADELIRLGWRP
jgi:hypothetical protein